MSGRDNYDRDNYHRRDENRYTDRNNDRHTNKRSRSRSRDGGKGKDSNRDRRGEEVVDRNDYRGVGRDERRDKGNGRNRDRDENNYGGNRNSSHKEREEIPVDVGEPTCTLILRGLPIHTNSTTLQAMLAQYTPQDIRLINDKETGDCKGFAFVEFPSLEHSQYFVSSFAGSGDRSKPQLIIENKPISISYARDNYRTNNRAHNDIEREVREHKPIKTDWLCDSCSCQNFSKRELCFRCNLPRNERCISVASNGEPLLELVVGCDIPSPFLVVQGLNPYVVEDGIIELFRQYAVVKSCQLLRDYPQNISKGIAFVEFHSIEHSIYSYGCIAQQGLYLDHDLLSVQYANQTHMLAMLNKMKIKQTQAGIGMANLALQAAQWSTSNSSSSQSQHYPQPQQLISAPRIKPSFPQSFETHGGSYIFQAPSGYFYEPVSEFYYDPKSKLYYNSNDGVYFKHSLALDPPFYRFEPPIPIGIDNTIVEQNNNNNNNNNALNLARKPVIMSIGLNKSSKLPVTKKIANDLGKWADRNNIEEEDNDEDINSAFKTKNSKVNTIVPSTSIEINNKISIVNNSSSVVPSTSSNISVCLLCKRQFASSEQLLRHEKESKLHKENLIKQQLSKNESNNNSTASYRDRASERRSVHGTSTEPIFNMSINPEYIRDQRNNLQTSSSSPPPPQSLNTDFNNPGNQLLRKMGYSGEGGLGRDQSGIEEAIGVNNNNSNINSNDKSGIGSNNSNCNIDYNNNYKNSLLNATRQRFENNFNKK